MNSLGLRKNAIWSLAGSGVLQFSNVILLVAISRLLGGETLGNFSFAIAFCSPVIAFSTLGLRSFQVIEPSERFNHIDFRRVQFVSSIVAISVILIFAVCSGKSGEAFFAILAVAVSQATSSQLDVYFAYFQKVRRMDIVAGCRVVNALTMVPCCLLVAFLTRDLIAVVGTMLVVRLLSLFLHAKSWMRRLSDNNLASASDWSRVRHLAFSSIPVAALIGISALEVSVPSLILEQYDGPVVLGHFTVLTTICLPVPFILSSILQAALPYLGGNSASRARISRALVVCLAFLSSSALVVVLLFGTELLRLFLGEGYVPIERQLVLALGVGFTSVVATILSFSLLAKRVYGSCVRHGFASFAITLLCSFYLIPSMSLSGAVIAPLAGRIVSILLALALLQRIKTEDTVVLETKLGGV